MPESGKPMKIGHPQEVVIVDGIPQCPCCHQPMRERGNDQWDCPNWGPLLDKIRADMDAVLDPMLLPDAPPRAVAATLADRLQQVLAWHSEDDQMADPGCIWHRETAAAIADALEVLNA